MNVAPSAPYYAPGPAMQGTWRSPGYRSARLRARSSYVAFGFLLLAAVIWLIANWQEWVLLDQIEGGHYVTVAEANSADKLVAGGAAWFFIFSIVSAVCFLAWLSRSVDNAPPLLAGTPVRSPGEAIGWWFVPFACFLVPYQITKDLFERLAIRQRAGGSGKVLAWWLMLVGSSIVSAVAGVVSANSIETAETIGPLKESQALWIVAGIVRIGGVIFALWLIHEIQSRADERAAGLGLSPEGVPVWPTRPQAGPPPSPYPQSWTGLPTAPYPPAPPAPFSTPFTAPGAAYGTPPPPPPLSSFSGAYPPPPPTIASAVPATSSLFPAPPAVERCANCGQSRVGDMPFCARCGRDFTSVSAREPEPR